MYVYVQHHHDHYHCHHHQHHPQPGPEIMSDRVGSKDLTYDVDKAFAPSPASPYSSITTTTLSSSSSSTSPLSYPYSSSTSSSSFSTVSSLSPASTPSSTLPDFLTSPPPSTSSEPTNFPPSSSSSSSPSPHYQQQPSPQPPSSSSSCSHSPSSSSLSTSSTSSSSSSSSTIPLTPPPTPPTPSAVSCQMTFQEAVQSGNMMQLQRLLEDLEGKININLFDHEGQTALHQGCLRGNLELVKLLVRFGADVGLANRDGWNPLHIAAYGGHVDILGYLSSVPRKKKSSS